MGNTTTGRSSASVVPEAEVEHGLVVGTDSVATSVEVHQHWELTFVIHG
jgi:hypothetical protein